MPPQRPSPHMLSSQGHGSSIRDHGKRRGVGKDFSGGVSQDLAKCFDHGGALIGSVLARTRSVCRFFFRFEN